jgi:hypothetical protein
MDLLMPLFQMHLAPLLISLGIGIIGSWHRCQMYQMERYIERKYQLEQQAQKDKQADQMLDRAGKYIHE